MIFPSLARIHFSLHLLLAPVRGSVPMLSLLPNPIFISGATFFSLDSSAWQSFPLKGRHFNLEVSIAHAPNLFQFSLPPSCSVLQKLQPDWLFLPPVSDFCLPLGARPADLMSRT
jgi:hypothetical protein